MNILFLCQRGGAKSVIAASYFNRLAQEEGLPYVADAAATEDAYDAVPAVVVALLEGEGHDVRSFTPRRVEERDLSGAARVVGIDCEIADKRVTQWQDVPKVSDDPEGSAAAIRRHVVALVDELRRTR